MISKISFGSRTPGMIPDAHFTKMQALLDSKFPVKPVEKVRLFGGETPSLKPQLTQDSVEFTSQKAKTPVAEAPKSRVPVGNLKLTGTLSPEQQKGVDSILARIFPKRNDAPRGNI